MTTPLADLGRDAASEPLRFGRVAVMKGYITPEQLQEALREQEREGAKAPLLGQLLLRRGWLTVAQFLDVLKDLKHEVWVCGSCGKEYTVLGDPGGSGDRCPRCGGDLRAAAEIMARSFDEHGIGRYKIEGEVGQGGMGVVFRAVDPVLKRTVALKVLKDTGGSRPQRLYREAVLAGKLHHPGIVAVHEAGEVEGVHFIAMDFVEGKPLDALLPSMELRARIETLAKVADAVGHAHSKGVIHRDLKPANVIVTPEGQPVLTDFGLAKMEGMSVQLTVTGQMMGTPAYMSPEQVEGRTEAVGPRADVYGLGVMLYEMLTNRMPYEGANMGEICSNILLGGAPPPRAINPDLSRELESVCIKAMELDPRHRYADGAELAAELSRWLRGEGVRAKPVGLTQMAWRRVKRHPLLWGMATALVVVPAVAAWIALSLRGQVVEERARLKLAEVDGVLQEWNSRRYLPVHDVTPFRAKLRAAAGDLEALIADAPAHELYGKLGRIRVELGEIEAAQEALAEAVRLGPTEGEHHFWLSRAHEERHARELERALQSGSRSAREAADAWRTRALDEMRASLALAWTKPSWRKAYAQAYVLYLEGDTDEAEKACRRLATDYPADGGEEGLMLLGRLTWETRPDVAIPAFDEAADRARSLAAARAEGARIRTYVLKEMMNHGADLQTLDAAYRTAREGIDAAVTIDPTVGSHRMRLGMLLAFYGMARFERGADPVPSYQKALEAFDAALGLDVADYWSMVGRAQVLSNLSNVADPPRWDEAAALYERARAVRPTEAAAHAGLGAVHFNRALRSHDPADYRASEAALSKAIELRPDEPEYWKWRGEMRAEWGLVAGAEAEQPDGLWLDAIDDHDKAIELNPAFADAYLYRALARQYLARHSRSPELLEDAVDDLVKVTEELNPRSSLAWTYLGDVRALWLSMEPTDALYVEADEAYGKAIEVNAALAQPRLQRARLRTMWAQMLYSRGSDPRETMRSAIADYDAAFAAGERGIGPRLEAANARLQLGEPDQLEAAARDAQAVIAADETSPVGWRLLGIARLNQERPAEAREAFARAMERAGGDDRVEIEEWIRKCDEEF